MYVDASSTTLADYRDTLGYFKEGVEDELSLISGELYIGTLVAASTIQISPLINGVIAQVAAKATKSFWFKVLLIATGVGVGIIVVGTLITVASDTYKLSAKCVGSASTYVIDDEIPLSERPSAYFCGRVAVRSTYVAATLIPVGVIAPEKSAGYVYQKLFTKAPTTPIVAVEIAALRAGNTVPLTAYENTLVQNLTKFGDPAILKSNMAKVGAVVVSNMKTAAHHIVAAGEAYFYAAEARKILIKFGVHIDEAANGVILPTVSCDLVCNHRVIHSNKYFQNVYNAIKDSKTKAELIQNIDKIRIRLLNGDTSVYNALDPTSL